MRESTKAREERLGAVFAMILLACAGAMLLSAVSSERALAASPDLPAPSITSIDMSQAYRVQKASGAFSPEGSGKWYAKGEKDYADWADSNVVEIEFTNVLEPGVDKDYLVEYYLQRSTSPDSGFQGITKDNAKQSFSTKLAAGKATNSYDFSEDNGDGHYAIRDCAAKRGNRYYYRVVAKYTPRRQSMEQSPAAERASDLVSIRTTPKTFNATSFKVKTLKGWKKGSDNEPASGKGKKREHTYKITWKKRKDVDGYFVYRINVKWVNAAKMKPWQYHVSGSSVNAVAGLFNAATAKRYCKKVKMLKANATSYKFKLKDKNYGLNSPTFVIAIVPYIKQNGKIYKADAKKVFFVLGEAYDDGQSIKSRVRYHVWACKEDYLDYVPFAL